MRGRGGSNRSRSTDSLESHGKFFGVGGCGHGDFVVNVFVLDQLDKGGGEVDHTGLAVISDDIEEFAFPTFEDEFSDDGGIEEDFDGGDSSDVFVEGGEEFLVDDGLQVVGEEFSDLLSFAGGEQVVDSTEGLPSG